MQICPKCGYIDHPFWRHKNWRLHIGFCSLEEFTEIKPELAEKLKAGHKVVCDDHFCYRLCGKFPRVRPYVERVMKALYDAGGVSAFRTQRDKHIYHDAYQKRIPAFVIRIKERETLLAFMPNYKAPEKRK